MASAVYAKCRLCTATLQVGDDRIRGVCAYCSTRPEAKTLDQPRPAKAASTPRAFTPADRSLIQRLQGHVAVVELLRILNDRLVADLGPAAPRYTPEQLQAALATTSTPARDQGWAAMRHVLADARRSGVLASITPVVIDDFATVFQLTPAQVTTLKDVIQHARDS